MAESSIERASSKASSHSLATRPSYSAHTSRAALLDRRASTARRSGLSTLWESMRANSSVSLDTNSSWLPWTILRASSSNASTGYSMPRDASIAAADAPPSASPVKALASSSLMP